MKVKDILYTIANIFVGGLLLALGALELYSHRLAYGSVVDAIKPVVTAIYSCLFGFTLILAECGIRILITSYCGFLNNLFGRGMFYIFAGVLIFSVQPIYMLILSCVCIFIGFTYMFLHCIPSARPTHLEGTEEAYAKV